MIILFYMVQLSFSVCRRTRGFWPVFFMLAGSLHAASSTWVASSGGGSWKTAANWSANAAPGAGDSLVFSGSAGSNTWTLTGTVMEIQDMAYALVGHDRRLRNDSSSADSTLALNGGGANGGVLINLSTGRNFSLQATGGGTTPHGLAVQLKTSGTFNSNGTNSDATLGGAGLVVNTPVTESGGSRSLTLTGSGFVTLTGNNNYSGGTVVSMNGGTVLMSGSGTAGMFNGTLGAASGSLTVQSGVLDLGATAQIVGLVSISGGTIQGGSLTGASFAVNVSGVATIRSALAGSGGLEKSGGGKLVLSGSCAYSGTTVLAAGTLVAGGCIAASPVWVTGGKLCGSGTVGAIVVQNSGAIGAGTDAETGVLSGDSLDLQANAHLLFRLGGPAAGTGYDRLILAGGITLAGDLQGSLLNGFTPAGATFNPVSGRLNFDGDKFFILLGAGVAGAFSNAGAEHPNLPGYGTITFGGQEFAIGYAGNAAANTFTGGNDVVLMAIPEPATGVAVWSALPWLAFRRGARGKRKSQPSAGASTPER
jgi:autotransporter-associated beta strand protein